VLQADDDVMLLRLNNGMALDPGDVDTFATLKGHVNLNEGFRARLSDREREFAATIVSESHESSVAKLRAFTDSLERRLSHILSGWSIPFALTLFRSMVAINRVEKFDSPEEFARNLRLMELAIARYCRYDAADVSFDAAGIWHGNVLRSDVEVLLEASSTAQLLGVCQVDLRRLAYGGGTLVTAESSWTVSFTDSLERLAKSYGERLARYGNAFAHSGTPGTRELPYGYGNDWLLLGGKNESGTIWSGLLKAHVEMQPFNDSEFISETDSYVPPLRLEPFSLDETAQTLRRFAGAFEEQSFTVDAAIALLKADAELGEALYCTFRHGHRIRTVGFTIASRSGLIRRACEALGGLPLSHHCDTVEAALRFIERSAGDATHISFNEHSGARHYVDLGNDRLLIDYMTSFSAVRRLYELIGGVTGAAANVRATYFEQYVAKRLADVFPAGTKLWSAQRLTFEDGSKREVDVAFVFGDLLILCECKARTQPKRRDGITRSLLETRAATLEKDLRQVDSLAALLTQQRVRGPSPLPEAVRHILPCVITTNVEWTANEDPSYWLKPYQTPRVCTIDELADVLREGQQSQRVRINGKIPLP